MDANSNQYAIEKSYNAFNDANKTSFLLLTKYMFEIQEKIGFDLLNIENEGNELMFQNYPALNEIQDTNISQIYQEYDLFLEIKKCVKRTSKFNKIPLKLNNYLTNVEVEEKDQILNYLNTVMIINLVKKHLKNKCQKDVDEYNLFNKLNKINTNLVTLLNLEQVQQLVSKEDMNEFVENTYNYQNLRELLLNNGIKNEDYDKCYRVFELFI